MGDSYFLVFAKRFFIKQIIVSPKIKIFPADCIIFVISSEKKRDFTVVKIPVSSLNNIEFLNVKSAVL